MPNLLPPLLALGIPSTLAVIFFLHFRRAMDGPTASIVVVDRRTMRQAQTRIDQAIEEGRLARAHAGLTALTLWLRGEVQSGPKRYRVAYASALELAQLRKEQLQMRLPGHQA